MFFLEKYWGLCCEVSYSPWNEYNTLYRPERSIVVFYGVWYFIEKKQVNILGI